jgi:ABC-type branched-subunit amino acid transport system substrate-binding protein
VPPPSDRLRPCTAAGRSGRELLRRRVALLFSAACVSCAAVALSACNSDHRAVSTTVVAPPPGCNTSRVVVVGASLDLSGPEAWLGREYLTGLQLGIARVNAGGGIPPHHSCLELMYKDDRGSAPVDDQAMLDLVNVEKAGTVVGSFLGSPTAAYLGRLGIPAISLSDVEGTFEPSGFPNTFPVTASIRSQVSVIAGALERRKVTSVGLVVTDDAASRQGAAYLAALSSVDGFTITASATIGPSGYGATSAVRRVRAIGPSALVVIDDTGAVASVLGARAALGWNAPVFAGPDTAGAGVFQKLRGDTAGIFVVVPTGALAGSGPASSATFSFRRKLLVRIGRSSLQGSIIPYAETYDAMTMMGAAANGSMGVVASDVTSFLQNANYQGVLATYTYTSGAHSGVSATDQALVPLDTLSNGLLRH